MSPQSCLAQSPLVSLPDDVLIHILKQLCLQTQLNLTRVHIRFLRIMPHVWRSQCKIINFSSIKLPLRDDDLRFFLASNQQTFEVVILKYYHVFNMLTDYVFPNIHDLVLGSHLKNFCVHKAIKNFPNLRSFTPIGGFTGEQFENFIHLESLTLTFCESFEKRNLLPILEACKLKTLKLGRFNNMFHQEMDLPFEGIQFLEVLKCNQWEMKWFMKDLKNLARLKHIILCGKFDDRFIKDVLTEVAEKSIKSVEFNDEVTNFMFIMDNLNGRIQSVKVLDNWLLFDGGYGNLKAIKELYLKKCSTDDVHVLDTLFSLKFCETLVIEHFTSEQIFEYTLDTCRIARGRRTKLHVYLYKNKFEEKLTNSWKQIPINWKIMGKHPLVEVHLEQKPNISYSFDPFSIFFDLT
ncbi:uncharacterized protein [Drosophila kikkawai]|uniref:F-box domain-containing protein n=1 Tax=Drosophila kikkawai TaxID=30033 RepID=A0ABM4GI45_DROKI